MNTICFDLDGVLVDFENGVKKLTNTTASNQKINDDGMWEKIKKVDDFYLKLEPIEGMIEIFNDIKKQFKNIEMLNAIHKPKKGINSIYEDKTNLVKKHL